MNLRRYAYLISSPYLRRRLMQNGIWVFMFLLGTIFFIRGAPRTTNNMVLGGESHQLRGNVYQLSVTIPSRRGAAQSPSVARANKEPFKFAIIADLDTQSREPNSKGFKSYYMEGVLTPDSLTKEYSVSWSAPQKVTGKINTSGRGLELSEMVKFNGKTYTCDDRTGILYEVIKTDKGAIKLVSRIIINSGNGDSDKFMKCEWAAVKDDSLFVGSSGREFTGDNGEVVHSDNKFVAKISADFTISYEDWSTKYDKLREAAGVAFPGYMIHEAVAWSAARQKWVFLPRRVSSTPYDEKEDEQKGSNMVLLADEDFSNITTMHIGKQTGTRGFSAFRFVPESDDNLIVALKSEENSDLDTQATYVTMFNLNTGVVLLQEEKVADAKYEGLSFL